MAGEPTATLEAPAAITAVTSARKLLRVTYTAVSSCSALLITSPDAPVDICDPDCPFETLYIYRPSLTISILTDGEGHRYCGWTQYRGVITPATQILVVTGLASAPGITGAESLNGLHAISLSSMGLDLDDPCAFTETSPGWHTIASLTVGGITFPVQITIGPGWNVQINLFGGQSATAYLESPSTSPCDFTASVSLAVRSTGGYAGWLDFSGASFHLEPLVTIYEIRPVFDTDNRLSSIELRWRTNLMDPETYESDTAWTVADAPVDCAGLLAGKAVSGSTVWAGTTVSSPAPEISLATIGTGDIRVAGPLGYDEVATFVSADQAVDAETITATYSVPPPEDNIWCWQYNGTYTVSMVSDEVADLGGQYVADGTLGTFSCLITGEPILEPLFLAGYLMAATETLVFPMELTDGTALKADATVTVLIRTTAGTWVAPTSGPTNDGNGYYSVTVTDTTHFATYGTLLLKATATGCRPTTQAYKAGPIAADEQAIDGDFDGAKHDREDLEDGYERGEVVSSADYSGSGYGCDATTTAFCTTLPLRTDSAEIGTTGLYNGGYARHLIRLEGDAIYKVILKSETYNGYTKITLALPLVAAPADGTHVTIGGSTEPETAEA
jgi:hypothetical protein